MVLIADVLSEEDEVVVDVVDNVFVAVFVLAVPLEEGTDDLVVVVMIVVVAAQGRVVVRG